MDHTKKFVLVDPRFARPSMLDKTLSGLDNEISVILNSNDSDEIKAKNYVSALARFKNYSNPPNPTAVLPPPPAPVVTPPQIPPDAPPIVERKRPSVTFKTKSPPKRRHKHFRIDDDPTLWKRTLRTPMKKKFSPNWLTYDESPNERKTLRH